MAFLEFFGQIVCWSPSISACCAGPWAGFVGLVLANLVGYALAGAGAFWLFTRPGLLARPPR